jgi:LysM repeat protein
MYEVCMSAERRVEPNFSEQSLDWENEPAVSLGPEHLYYEEDTSYGFGGLLMKSGLVILLAITGYAGYQFLQSSKPGNQLASSSAENQWPGGVLSTKENLKRKVRQIDLTKTATVKKSITRPVKTTVIKPIKKDSARLGDKTKQQKVVLTGNEQLHVVQPGDTISAISRKFKIGTKEIMAMNGIENPRLLRPGMKLVVSR